MSQPRPEELQNFLQHLLIYACQFKCDALVTEICGVLQNKNSRAMKKLTNDKDYSKVVEEIVHHKSEDELTPLCYVRKHHEFMNGLALLKLEIEAHGKENGKDCLKCITQGTEYYHLDPWLIDSFKAINSSEGFGKKIKAIFDVLVFVIPSIVFYFSDLYTDLILCIQYYYMVYVYGSTMNTACFQEDEDKSCLVQTLGNFSCSDSTSTLSAVHGIVTEVNCSSVNDWVHCFENNDNEIQIQQYKTAFYVMIAACLISLITYWLSAKNIEISKSKKVWKNLIVKVIWPFTYAYGEYQYRIDPHYTESDLLKVSKSTWHILKNIENGLENFAQILLQVYLLSPYVNSIRNLPWMNILYLSVNSIYKSFSIPNLFCIQSNVDTALGKLLLSILSISYGVSSRKTSKPGQTFGQSIKNLVLWISYFFITISRTVAIFSIISQNDPVTAILISVLVHLIVVAIVKMMTDDIGYLNDDKDKLWKRVSWCALSCLASHTFRINFKDNKRGTNTFYKESAFQFVIVVENIILLLLPDAFPNLYPNNNDCYQFSYHDVLISFLLWFLGIILQVWNHF